MPTLNSFSASAKFYLKLEVIQGLKKTSHPIFINMGWLERKLEWIIRLPKAL